MTTEPKVFTSVDDLLITATKLRLKGSGLSQSTYWVTGDMYVELMAMRGEKLALNRRPPRIMMALETILDCMKAGKVL